MPIPINILRINKLRRSARRGLSPLVLALTLCLFAASLFPAPLPAAPPVPPPVAASMSDTDREHLLVHFQMTTQMVAEQVHGFRPRNWSTAPRPTAGRSGNVVSHLAVAEPDYWRESRTLKAPPDMKGKHPPHRRRYHVVWHRSRGPHKDRWRAREGRHLQGPRRGLGNSRRCAPP